MSAPVILSVESKKNNVKGQKGLHTKTQLFIRITPFNPPRSLILVSKCSQTPTIFASTIHFWHCPPLPYKNTN